MVIMEDGFTTRDFIVRDAIAFEAWIQTWESNDIDVIYRGVFDDDLDSMIFRNEDNWFDLFREILPHAPVTVRLTHTHVPSMKYLNEIFGAVESEAFFDELSNYLILGECVVWHTFKILTLPHPYNPSVEVVEDISIQEMGAVVYSGETTTQTIKCRDDTFEFNALVPHATINFTLNEYMVNLEAPTENVNYYPDLKLLEIALVNVENLYDLQPLSISLSLSEGSAVSGLDLPGIVLTQPEGLAALLREYNKLSPWLPLFTNGVIELYPSTHNFTSEDEDQCARLWFTLKRRWSCFPSVYEKVKPSLIQVVEMDLDNTRKLMRVPLSTYDNLEAMEQNMVDDFIIKGVNYYYMTIHIAEPINEPTNNNAE